jgi:hypothetical protein
MDDGLNQFKNLAGFGVAAGFEFGVHQLAVDADLIASAVGGDQADGFDLWLKVAEQLTGQAHGPIGVVSDRTVDNLNIHHVEASRIMMGFRENYNIRF